MFVLPNEKLPNNYPEMHVKKNEREIIITNQREEKKTKMNDTNESHRQQVFTYD
jgi:hypothetical protein